MRSQPKTHDCPTAPIRLRISHWKTPLPHSSAGEYETVSVYDVATWTRIGDPIPSHSPFIFPGHLRPDGAVVIVTVRDGIQAWDIDPDHLAQAACLMAGRNLTETEWETYLSSMGDYRETCDF